MYKVAGPLYRGVVKSGQGQRDHVVSGVTTRCHVDVVDLSGLWRRGLGHTRCVVGTAAHVDKVLSFSLDHVEGCEVVRISLSYRRSGDYSCIWWMLYSCAKISRQKRQEKSKLEVGRVKEEQVEK